MRFILSLSLSLLLVGVPWAQTPTSLPAGPAVGTVVPAFSAVDQFGRTQTLQSLMGRDGLMLVFYRSADW